MSRSTQITVEDTTRVAAARRQAANLAHRLNMTDTQAGRVSLVVTEAANNLVKHAREGQILLRTLEASGVNGLEIIAVDRGPGMKNIARCMEDGYSTAGSPGTGLGAIRRLSDEFDIYSQDGKGTVVLSRVLAGRAKPAPVQVGAVCLPMIENEPCGDAWTGEVSAGMIRLLVADGLGHGPMAAEAADQAVIVFKRMPAHGPKEIIEGCQGPLRATRGASVAVIRADLASNELRFASVGNISGVILHEESSRSMISHNGTVGHEITRVQEFTYPWLPGATLVFHSDGLLSRWSLAGYQGLMVRDPAIISAVLVRDFRRPKDDVTVVVVGRQKS